MEKQVPILIPEFDISRRVHEVAEEIADFYLRQAIDSIDVVQLLEGACMVNADLVREIYRASGGKLAVEIHSMKAKSYNGTRSSGTVEILLDVKEPLDGRHVLIVEDILDTRLTYDEVHRRLSSRSPASLMGFALLDKAERKKVNIEAEHIGFKIPDVFVVGYGLDCDGKYRNLPYIGKLD